MKEIARGDHEISTSERGQKTVFVEFQDEGVFRCGLLDLGRLR
jgi:hypothetical protein